jgi:Trypsin-like peptidase domain
MFYFMLALLLGIGQPMDLPVSDAARSVVMLHAPLNASNAQAGTGFLVQLPGALFLVTAEHVARGIGANAQVTFGAAGDVAQTASLADLAGSAPPAWVFHGQADVAVIALRGRANLLSDLASRGLQPAHLVSSLEAPTRDRPLTVFGFPLGLGGLTLGPDRRVSPLSRESRAASGLLTLQRADTHTSANFYLLADPSVGGYSGAPVFMLSAPFVTGQSIGFGPPVGFCMGLVHGTVSDGTGGKLAAIVPVAYVTETLQKAFHH